MQNSVFKKISDHAGLVEHVPCLFFGVIIIPIIIPNNNPYNNAGIEQTWEFAHPLNRQYTGPLSNFIKMMYSDSYSIMINHKKHNINLVEQGVNISFFLVELVDKTDDKFKFQWIVEKVLMDGVLKNCWMTTSVSQPVLIAKSA